MGGKGRKGEGKGRNFGLSQCWREIDAPARTYAYMTDRSNAAASHRPCLQRLKRRTADSSKLRPSPADLDAFRHSKFKTVSRSLFALRRLTFERRFSTFPTYDFRRTPTGLPPLFHTSLPRMERSPQTYRSRNGSHHRPQHLSDDRKQHAWRYSRHFQTSRSGQQPHTWRGTTSHNHTVISHTSTPITSMFTHRVNHFRSATSGFCRKKKSTDSIRNF